MTDKRLIIALLPLALLAACNDEVSDDSRSASGEVLEGTVSDAMLPVDRVRSEPPLEDPEAFAEAQEEATEAAAEAAGAGEAEEGEAAEDEGGDAEEAAVEAAAPETD